MTRYTTESKVLSDKRHASHVFHRPSILCVALLSLFLSDHTVRGDSSSSMSVVGSGLVSDSTRVEARISIRNPSASSKNYNLELYLDSALGEQTLANTIISIPASGQELHSHWIPTAGIGGSNNLRYRVTTSGEPDMQGESHLQVVASDTRSVPLITAAWMDPGAILPGVYFQTRSVTAQDVRDRVDSAHDVGIDTLIITYSEYILNGWGAFYPSQHYPNIAGFDVVGTILNQASANGQKVFVGLGRGNDLNLTWNGFDDPNRIAAGLAHGTDVATELWDLYADEPSFYGWYLSHEANDIEQASDAHYNPMTDVLRGFEADKPVLVSPSGTPIISPTILSNSKVDIFAYQDAVGSGYIPYENTFDPNQRIDMLDSVYSSYQTAHAGTDKHLWTNLENWQMDGPTYSNAYAADFSRLSEQLEIEKNYVDNITSYEWLGFTEPTDTDLFLGGITAVNLYSDYKDYYEQIARTLKTVNFVRNSGFEQGVELDGTTPLNWEFGGNGSDQTLSPSTDAPGGSAESISLDVDSATGLPWLTQDIPITEGDEYKFSAWVKELVSDPSDGWLAAQVWMLSDAGSAVILDSTSLLFSDPNWQLQSSLITAPAGATIARLIFAIQDDSFGVGTGNYLIDGVSLVGPEAPIPGDFDLDGDVDGDDLIQWKNDSGINGDSDADGDGDSDGFDFLIWQQNITGSNAIVASAAVPEPTTVVVLCVGLAMTVGLRRCQR